MKGALLALLAIGIPLILLMVVQHLVTARRVPAVSPGQPPSPPRTVVHAVKTHPSTPDPSTRAVAVPPAGQTGVLDGIDEWLTTWNDRVQQDPELRLRAAARSLTSQQYERALREFDRLLVQRPDESTLLLGKAMALTGLKRYEDSLPLFERVIEQQPDDIAARFNYGVALMRSGHLNESASAYEAALRQDPGHVQAQFNLAVLYQASRRPREAIAAWRKLTDDAVTLARLSPNSRCDAWFHRGEMAISLYLSDEAEQCFQHVVAIEPNDARAWCNIGIARASSGRRSEALDALKESLRLDPRLVPAMNQCALIHAAIHRDAADPASRAAAVEWCRRSLAIEPNQASIRALRETLEPRE